MCIDKLLYTTLYLYYGGGGGGNPLTWQLNTNAVSGEEALILVSMASKSASVGAFSSTIGILNVVFLYCELFCYITNFLSVRLLVFFILFVCLFDRLYVSLLVNNVTPL